MSFSSEQQVTKNLLPNSVVYFYDVVVIENRIDSLASSLFDWDNNTMQEFSSISFLVNRWWTKRAKVWILSAKPVNKWGKNVQLVRVSFVPK